MVYPWKYSKKCNLFLLLPLTFVVTVVVIIFADAVVVAVSAGAVGTVSSCVAAFLGLIFCN
jgi:hypothetical protein